MFYVKKMSLEDFGFAVRLTDTKGWNLIEDDFKFALELEPEGCFVLYDNAERIGIITSINFGKIGWFGNLIIEEKNRKKGAGSLLVRHVVNYLKSKNVETVGLYSYIDTVSFYKKLGFKYDSDFIVLEGKTFASTVKVSVKEARKQDYQKIIEYDHHCLGISRKKLLEKILHNPNNLCYFVLENEQIQGYIMAKVYEEIAEIGSLVCQSRRKVAIDLVKTILNKLEGFQVSLCIPEKEKALHDFLTKSGINEHFHVARMFYKPLNLKECIYIAESLERG